MNLNKVDTPLIEVKNLSKSFLSSTSDREDLVVFFNLSFILNKGELLTIFGPNGCGKTTILNILSGVLKPDSGKVIRKSDDKKELRVGYVFQNHTDTLLPWRTVNDNINFPLELKNNASSDNSKRVKQIMGILGLTEHADKYIYELSGGLKQLVAIARATVNNPHLLLLDEPFSALDHSTSRKLWLRFRKLCNELNVTTIFISHNIDEAVFLGDRVFVLSSIPAKIVGKILTPFDKKRSLDILTSNDFFRTRSKVLALFERGRSK